MRRRACTNVNDESMYGRKTCLGPATDTRRCNSKICGKPSKAQKTFRNLIQYNLFQKIYLSTTSTKYIINSIYRNAFGSTCECETQRDGNKCSGHQIIASTLHDGQRMHGK